MTELDVVQIFFSISSGLMNNTFARQKNFPRPEFRKLQKIKQLKKDPRKLTIRIFEKQSTHRLQCYILFLWSLQYRNYSLYSHFRQNRRVHKFQEHIGHIGRPVCFAYSDTVHQ